MPEMTIEEARATIQQLEALNKGLDAELEMYRSIAEREGAEIAVSQLAQEQVKVKQLEARVKELEEESRQWEKGSVVALLRENKALKALVAQLQGEA